MSSFTRRATLIGAGIFVGAGATRYLINEEVPYGLPAEGKSLGTREGIQLNDASKLSATRVQKHLTLNNAPDEKLIEALRSELQLAKSEGRPFVVSAARHSMGAQSLADNGTAITLDQDWLETDTKASTCRVAAGMRWSEVIRQLDAIGYSPKVMQSNNDFGVASTFCVNAHGWPVPFSAFGSTVRSFRMILPDGELVQCSRTENSDLFNLSMGGYGLIGAILDLEIEMVPNSRLTPVFEEMPAEEFGKRFIDALKQGDGLDMAYGRLDVSIDTFFRDALLVTYRQNGDQAEVPPLASTGFVSRMATKVLRKQLNYDRAKNLRWFIETSVGPRFSDDAVSRNSLMNEPVFELGTNGPDRTDILHEYFVSPEKFPAFIQACRDVIPSSFQQLLNVTLRFVDKDDESVLSYAREPRIAAVMLFSQEMSKRGEADMKRMTRSLIERIHAIGGNYYLPYRPHATQKQFLDGYPRAPEFIANKRGLDPDSVFRNTFWDRYMANL